MTTNTKKEPNGVFHPDYPKGKKFVVFCNDRSTVDIKEVQNVVSFDKDFVEILWSDKTQENYSNLERLLLIPYDAPYWAGDIMRRWAHLLNGGTETICVKLNDCGNFEIRLSGYMKPLIVDTDGELKAPPTLLSCIFFAHQYPDDPVEKNTIRFNSSVDISELKNEWAHMTSFADVLVNLFNSAKCTCPKECDCQKPPSENEDEKIGVHLVSNHCPVHNESPLPDEDCPLHYTAHRLALEEMSERYGLM